VRIAPLLLEELLFEYAELGLRWFAPLSPLRRRSVAARGGARCRAVFRRDLPASRGRGQSGSRSPHREFSGCDPMALTVVPEVSVLVDGVSCRGSQHRSADRPNEIW